MRDLPRREMQYKTYGRIFVKTEEHRQRVEKLIEKIDEFEYGYMPGDLIKVYAGRWHDLVYLHKFEICKNKLSLECLKEGIPIFIIDGECDPLSLI